MYVPPSFEVSSTEWVQALANAYPFGLLVTCPGDLPQITHLPMLVERRDGGALAVLGHVARANPHADAIESGAPATAIFEGPHAYISPRWYAQPLRSVPTWNYAVVHASGRLRRMDERDMLDRLVAVFETDAGEPWRFEDVDTDYAQKQLRGIVAFELLVEQLIGKSKMSQNRDALDREGAIAALEVSPRELDRATADMMRDTGARAPVSLVD